MLVLYVISGLFGHATSHGQMLDPPARPYLGKLYPNKGFAVEDTYYGFNCGGFNYLHGVCGGVCGVCGDSCDDPNPPNEAGGRFATGYITKTYREGQIVNITVLLMANHQGYFEFRICPNNDVTKRVTHECLNKHVLQLADGSGTRYTVPKQASGNLVIPVRLPTGLTCTQCVIQWKMHNGNNWGYDAEHPRGGKGGGPQEEFYGCADVAIETRNNGNNGNNYHFFG